MEFSMEFHGILHGIPNSNLSFIKFNGIHGKFNRIPLNSINFPWNSMEKYNEKNPSNVYEKFHGMEFHGKI
jgi:hypothetical protein